MQIERKPAGKVSFKLLPCKTGEFLPKGINGAICANCGRKMLSTEFINKALGALSAEKGTPSEFARSLPEKLHLEDSIVLSYVLKAGMPARNFGEVVKNADITGKLGEISFLKSVKNLINEILTKGIKTVDITTVSDDKKHAAKKVLTQYFQPDSGSNKKYDKPKIFELLCKIAGDEKAEFVELFEILCELPQNLKRLGVRISEMGKNAEKGAESLRNLFAPINVTVEHISPKSKGGANDIDNYILLCGKCNRERSSGEYAKISKLPVLYGKNAQKQLEMTEKSIISGEFEYATPAEEHAYEQYPEAVAKRLFTATKGEVALRVLSPEKIRELKSVAPSGAELERIFREASCPRFERNFGKRTKR